MSEAVLLCRTGHDAGLSIEVGGESLVLGCDEAVSVVLDHDGVAPRHARVQATAGGVVVEAFAEGVRIDGRELMVGESAALGHLAALSIGTVDLVHVDRTLVPATEVLAAALLAPGGVRVPLALGANVMGSSEDCDLVVDDPAVAARHATLTLSSRGLLVEADEGAEVRLAARPIHRGEWARDGDELFLAATATFPITLVRGFGPPARETGEMTAGKGGDGPARGDEATVGAVQPVQPVEPVQPVQLVQPVQPVQGDAVDPDAATAGFPREAGSTSTHAPPLETTATSESTVRRALALRSRREAAVRLHAVLAEAADGGSLERVVLLREGRHVVGRGAECRAWLPDLSVSRSHAEIEVGADGVTVADLGSANGTWVGEERAERLAPEPGERFRFGDVVAWFERV